MLSLFVKVGFSLFCCYRILWASENMLEKRVREEEAKVKPGEGSHFLKREWYEVVRRWEMGKWDERWCYWWCGKAVRGTILYILPQCKGYKLFKDWLVPRVSLNQLDLPPPHRKSSVWVTDHTKSGKGLLSWNPTLNLWLATTAKSLLISFSFSFSLLWVYISKKGTMTWYINWST